MTASQDKGEHLFSIERSKNRNFVQYDLRLTGNRDVSNSNSVAAYWILQDGRREELNPVEKKYAYGIASQEQISKDKFKVRLAALKDREIIVEKMNGTFGAVVSINGKQSILEKVYIESKERLMGLPKVLYIDLFGRTKGKGFPIGERIIPK